MFPQRCVQGAIDALLPLLSPGDAKHAYKRLIDPFTRASAEWEIVGIAKFAELANVQHQPVLGGRRPDLHVRYEGSEFVADICAVSDLSLENANPVEHLNEEVRRVARSVGIIGSGLSIYVEATATSFDGGHRMLALPPKGDVPTFVRRHVRPFLVDIAKTQKSATLEIQEGDVHVRLEYDPTARFSGGGHLVYTNPRAADSNPLFSALTKKAKQLRETQISAIKGIIACDGGCETIRRSAPDVVRAFFERHQNTVGFVVIVDAVSADMPFPEPSVLRPRLRIGWNPRITAETREPIDRLLRAWGDKLPHLNRDPNNAFRYPFPVHRRHGQSFYGAVLFNADSARISARAFLRLLSGELEQTKFETDYPNIAGGFRYRWEHQQQLQAVSLQPVVDDDDDWLWFKFTGVQSKEDAGPTTSALNSVHRLFAGLLPHSEFAALHPDLVRATRKGLTGDERVVVVRGERNAELLVAFEGHDPATGGFRFPPVRPTTLT